jgi:hypothetical protein
MHDWWTRHGAGHPAFRSPRVPLFEMTKDAVTSIAPTTFGEQGYLERRDLQRLLKERLDVLGLDLLMVEEEHSNWEASQRRIDLLAIDRDANMVVIELKRDNKGAHMELQALRYAAMVSSMRFEQVVQRLATSDETTVEQAQDKLLEFLEWDSADDGEFNRDVKIVLVAGDFSPELASAVLWLNERQLDIRCVRLRPHVFGDRMLVNIEQMIPLPEASDYIFKQKEKTRSEREKNTAKGSWTGFWFVNVGEDQTGRRRWEDCVRYGFVSAGGNPRHRDKMMALRVGDPVLCYLKGHGYVGEGTVSATAVPLQQFLVSGEGKPMIELPMNGDVDKDRLGDDENGEFCVAVKWAKVVAREHAVCMNLAHRGTACRMKVQPHVDEIREQLGNRPTLKAEADMIESTTPTKADLNYKTHDREMAIATVWALRFNAETYLDDTGFDGVHVTEELSWLDRFLADGTLPEEPLQQMACFYRMQRFLGKWGGERCAPNGGAWRMFRTLLLATAEHEVPERYRMNDYYAQWTSLSEQQKQRQLWFIRQIHQTIDYNNDALPI